MFLKHGILKGGRNVADSIQLLDAQTETQPTAHLRCCGCGPMHSLVFSLCVAVDDPLES